ncbi:MAG TPA: PGPGW domain-containing protein [Anaeromyxobacteraceae bacterium]|nr:PGPGW domain-containing protein [Anaeromyxobacteraceae bacterium]
MTPATAAERSVLRRIAVEAAGWSLCAAGFALLFLPGPGLPLLVAGLALLARERPSAARLLAWIEERGRRARRRLRRTPPSCSRGR